MSTEYAERRLIDDADRLHRDLSDLVSVVAADGGVLIVANVVLSSLRSLQYVSSKLKAVDMLQQLCPHLSDDTILDRVLPYVVHLMADDHAPVRGRALQLLAQSLKPVRRLPRSDANVFGEYILPVITAVSPPSLLEPPQYLTRLNKKKTNITETSNEKLERSGTKPFQLKWPSLPSYRYRVMCPFCVQLAQDESVAVRATVARYVADLAEVALTFLELSHRQATGGATDEATPTSEPVNDSLDSSTGAAGPAAAGGDFEAQLHALQVGNPEFRSSTILEERTKLTR